MTQAKSTIFSAETTNDRDEFATKTENSTEQDSMDDRHHGSQHSLKSPEDERKLAETNTATHQEFADKGSSVI